jgi:hypothetical protein
VDRTGDDYPILIAPGNPKLRVNVTVDEIARYSPRKIDVVNLRDNTFETVEIADLLRECGSDFPDASGSSLQGIDRNLRLMVGPKAEGFEYGAADEFPQSEPDGPAGVVAEDGDDVHMRHQTCGNQDAGNDAAQEERPDRNAANDAISDGAIVYNPRNAMDHKLLLGILREAW